MDVYVEHDKSVVDPSLNVDEAWPSNVLRHENDVGADEGNYDEAENKDIGDGEDYEADNGSEREEDEGDEEDEHIDDIVDKEHIVDELEVEMDGFKFVVEGENEDPMQLKLNMNETDLEVLDFDSFESDIDDDKKGSRRKGLRKLRKEAADSTSTTSFYGGKEFPNRDVAKEMDKSKVFWCSSYDCQIHKKMIMNRGKEILDEGNKVEGNTQETAKGKKVNVSNKGKDKMVNEQEEDKTECPWVLYISKGDTGKWLVRTFKEEHKCLQSRKIKTCTLTFLLKHIQDLLVMNPEIPVKAIQEQMKNNNSCGCEDYVQELKRCNPNTTIKIDVYGEENPDSPTRMFRRIYVCLGALKDDFRASGRELLGLDGAFMKGRYSGQLLTTVGVDANNGIYPVAYGIGLLPVIAKLYPVAQHIYYVRHIYQNMNMTWKGSEYKEMLWNYATACTVVKFDKHMDTLKGLNKKAYECFNDLVVIRYHNVIERANCGLLVNNICEVFNRQFLDAKDSPIIIMLREKSIQYTFDWNRAELCQVRVCTCRKWEVSGIPCKHVMACIHDMADNGKDVNGRRSWEKIDCPTTLLPPKQHPQIARPPKKRKKSDGKFSTGSTKCSTADMGMKGKAAKPSAYWFWKPSQILSNKGPKNNSVSVMFKKYTYIDTQGRLKSVMAWVPKET
nr:hypothetical protein [Tanacetum cinerariifolium]